LFSRPHLAASSGIVGSSAPLAAGFAMAAQLLSPGKVAFSFFGDGAANQGQVYEAFNMAALWKLPILYVIENNRYAMGTAAERHASTTSLFQRGLAFAIPGTQVDGMDVLAVREKAQEVVKYVREGNGPFVLEALTYRYRGHSMSDPGKYRTKEEVQEMRERHDPIDRLKAIMAEHGVADEERFKQIDKEIRDICNEAARFAQDSPEPDPAELWTDVLVES
ncbi:MAG: thiamine pyrophosphate-dependent enzyme, partial [Geminicoccaceae bacterium]|nr:thiamine pyrophosphate-dependent enzyme [Geminicoccaceae bacterium]